jgi:hypothetical protein
METFGGINSPGTGDVRMVACLVLLFTTRLFTNGELPQVALALLAIKYLKPRELVKVSDICFGHVWCTWGFTVFPPVAPF